MQNKNIILTLSLCVITLAAVSTALLVSQGNVLGVTTQQYKPTRIIEGKIEGKIAVPPKPTIITDNNGSISCRTLTKFIADNCSVNITSPSPGNPSSTVSGYPTQKVVCRKGIAQSYLGKACTTTNNVPGYELIQFNCHDGYAAVVGESGSCIPHKELLIKATSICSGRSNCK